MTETITDRALSSAGLLLLLTATAMIMFADLGQHAFTNTEPNIAYHSLMD